MKNTTKKKQKISMQYYFRKFYRTCTNKCFRKLNVKKSYKKTKNDNK